ncbi:protein-disulfide reductase DsbD [Lonsdalea quercina]|uniref:protein-disulfide reductase DsbD n=1 Tax=Lonsdalea quercina TaxID=71657 RepID=UPI0039749089
MAQRFFTLIILFGTLLFTAVAPADNPFGRAQTSRFLPAAQAFVFDFQQQGKQLKLQWIIHSGYYLYRQKIVIHSGSTRLIQVDFPAAERHQDAFFGMVDIFRNRLQLNIPLDGIPQGSTLTVSYQGCADAGFCYPPEQHSIPLSQWDTGEKLSTAPPLPFSPWWAILIGIGIAFTPCVLPMYPLISSLILGRRERLSARRTLLLAFAYVQGMALTYTLLGLVVAAAGLRFQAALQHPYVLIGLALMFTLLALSMFGLFNLQLPSAMQTRLVDWSNRQESGSLYGVFLMGALAGLICSPCTTAPLSALLLYIAQSGHMLAGGGTLYLYALGMGLPLIGVTLFGNRILPKSGPWMNHIKEACGFAMLALPVFLLTRLLGDDWAWRLWGLLGVAFFGWAFALSLRGRGGWIRGLQVLLLLGALISVRPIQDWVFTSATSPTESSSGTAFSPINTVDELNTALRDSNKITMLDLYADWCAACKSFEKVTFSDGEVKRQMSRLRLLQADVTANTPEQNTLLTRLQVLGLPSILFFDASGKEIPGSRITGFMDAAQFRSHLQKLSPSTTLVD